MYTFIITATVGMPRLTTQMDFTSDANAIEYAKQIAQNFVGVNWFLTVEITKGSSGDPAADRHVGTVKLPKPKAEFIAL